MLPNKEQPKFWLQIRKEYIIDNFENLLTYLRYYDYDNSRSNGDYDSTLKQMTELCNDLRELICKTPMYAELVLPYDNETVVRLLCATALASKATGHICYSALITLCSILSRLSNTMPVEKMFRIIVNCLCHREIRSTGFTWETIMPRNNTPFSINFLFLEFSKLTFKEQSSSDTAFSLENQGSFIVRNNCIPAISVTNRSDFLKEKCDLQFNVNDSIEVYQSKGESSDLDTWYELTTSVRRLYSAQKNMIASARTITKQYEEGETFPVRITRKLGQLIVAETIDPRYEKLSGKVFIEFYRDRPSTRLLIEALKDGDYLMVNLSSSEDQNSFTFDTYFSFEDWYRLYVAEYAGNNVVAMFDGEYKTHGTRWISRNGFRLSLDSNKYESLTTEVQEEVDNAIRTNTPFMLKLYNNPPQMDAEIFNVYAEPAVNGTLDSTDSIPFTREQADRNLIQAFLEDCRGEALALPSSLSSISMEPGDCASLIPILHKMGLNRRNNCRTWYLYDTAAAMLARICGVNEYFEYLLCEQDYINSLVTFASNGELKDFTPPEKFASVPVVNERAETIRALSCYHKPDAAKLSIDYEGARFPDETEVLHKTKALVEASNSLIDIIDIDELDNIKRVLARLLGAADEYQPILDNRTFYGKEGYNLELKASAVYAPENLRRNRSNPVDPETQKFVLFKAVCGFLNSRSGGDLLIGVNDAGYAVGLNEEMNDLYQMKYISAPDMDQYRNYLQCLFDSAFREKGGSAKSTDIARTHISVDPETNAEDRSVIRVHVKPYKRYIIELNDTERPSWVANSYVRKNGRTEALSYALETEVLRYK